MKIIRIASWCIGIGIAVATALWWQHRHTAASSTMHFRTTTVQRGDVTQTVTGSGTLSAITTVDVGAQVSGKIIKLCVDYNDPVQKDQLIAEIDPTSYQARLVQAEADLLSAQAALELKQLNAKRSAELLEKRLLSQSDYDSAVAELHQQEASAKKADAAVNSARLDVEHCKITSPIDGVVLSRAVDVGQTVQSSMTAPTLYKLAQDLRQMQITANISEADIGGVAAGQSVQFSVDAFSGRTFEGKVREVRNNSTTTNNVVSYPTIITVDNSDLKLRPGMTANVTIYTARRQGVLRVANSALRFKVPEGAIVKTPDNTQSAGPNASSGDSSLDQMPEEIRQRMLADFDKNHDGKLDDSEKKAMHETMRARFASGDTPAGGPPPGFGPNSQYGKRPSGDRSAPAMKTLYVLASAPDASGHATGELVATPVRIGISDSTSTEILEGVKEGAIVAIGTTTAQAAAQTSSSTTTNPFVPQRPPGAGGPPPR
ncbi:MAG: efflux RND transporter periplasmic adaptor subunit [Nibricoccus sp.]